jgi:NAD(P) transhydrogenase subunit alpha
MSFISLAMVLLLAIFLGFELIRKVPATLHTPLMSGANAVSGITVIGAFVFAGNDMGGLAKFFGVLAIFLATINVVGGYMVTDRMLSMFKGKGDRNAK